MQTSTSASSEPAQISQDVRQHAVFCGTIPQRKRFRQFAHHHPQRRVFCGDYDCEQVVSMLLGRSLIGPALVADAFHFQLFDADVFHLQR